MHHSIHSVLVYSCQFLGAKKDCFFVVFLFCTSLEYISGFLIGSYEHSVKLCREAVRLAYMYMYPMITQISMTSDDPSSLHVILILPLYVTST